MVVGQIQPAESDAGRQVEPSQELLESWKRIAQYLRRDIRTLQRWEHRRSLPVHRLPGQGRASVYALKTELDAWRLGKTQLCPKSADLQTMSIAVLPFTVLSGIKRSRYFSQGLVDCVIAGLTHLPRLRVAARTLPVISDDTGGEVHRIEAGLRVSRLLEGSVQISGSRVRVSAQLVEVASGYHLWSDRYHRELVAGSFRAQDSIAASIIEAVRKHIRAGRHHK